MPKTKEQIRAYNKEYSARPEVIARAKVRNAQFRKKRAEYKKTERGKQAELKYRRTQKSKRLQSNIRLKSRYGITIEQYEQMLVEAENSCQLCGSSHKKLHIDHDHVSGKVRGILCVSCNMALGMLKDDTELMRKAINYLETS